MDYIATFSPNGEIILYETYNIQSIQLYQPINVPNISYPCYLVVINYTDRDSEQTVISHDSWQLWNQWQTERQSNEVK